MFHVLRLYGLPDKIIKGIETIYDNPAILFLSPDGATDSFQTTVKVIPLHHTSSLQQLTTCFALR